MSKEKLSAEESEKLQRAVLFASGISSKHRHRVIELLQQYEQLQREREEAANLLFAAECPDCDGSGIIPVETTRVGYGPADEYGNPTPVPVQEWEPTPCEWCAIKDSFLTP